MFAKQFYWYKRCGLLFKLRRPLAFQLSRGLFTGGRESHHFTGNRNPSPGCSPSPGSPTKGWIILMNLIQENILSFSCIQYVTRIVEEWKKIIQFDLYSSRKFSLFRRDRHLNNNSNMRNATNIGTLRC